MSGELADPIDPEADSLPSTVSLSTRDEHTEDSDLEFSISVADAACFHSIGRYQLRHELARGGMGTVLLAYDERLHREVAVKVLRTEFIENLELHQRFINESLLTSRLQHPSVIPIYDSGYLEDSRPYYVMKLMNGRSFADLLANASDTSHDWSQLLKIFEQVCLTIAYAHKQNVLHLDLKPGNVMVGDFGEIYVVDWGLGHICDFNNSDTKSDDPESQLSFEDLLEKPSLVSTIRGTPSYMSPEQARGFYPTTRSDVFGLGALLCEILTGHPPYRSKDPHQAHIMAMKAKVDDAMRLLDECPHDEALVNLAKKCLSPNPGDRPCDASIVVRQIGEYLESKLEQAESDLTKFFDISLDLFCIASLDGYFMRVNVNFPKVLGYSEHQLISRPFLDFVHPDDVPGTLAVMSDLSHGKPVVRFRNRYRTASGEFIVLEWTAQKATKEKTIFAVARDVSSNSAVDAHCGNN
jgi:serine/threonine-protein kinase